MVGAAGGWGFASGAGFGVVDLLSDAGFFGATSLCSVDASLFGAGAAGGWGFASGTGFGIVD